jgi:predicted ATP-grasp superfamily ATP-dependent carboligase
MVSPPPITSVLLVDHGNLGALAAVRALRAANYEPWLAIYESGTYASRSRATAGTVSVSNPYFDGEGFVPELAAAAARLSVAAVLPCADVDLYLLAGREADFAGITALGTPSPETVERATNKELLPDLAASAGLRTPPAKKVVRGDSQPVGTFGFPAIVKPLRSRVQNPDGTMVRAFASYVSTKQAAEKALEDLPGKEGLVQPYISGMLQSVAGVSWEGELVCALHQISERIWPVHAGISAYAKTIPPNLELERGLSRLLKALDWSGLFQAQFIGSRSGEYWLIDFNPRIYGSLALAVAAGLNLPSIWVDLLLGGRPDVTGYRIGVRFRHDENDVRALLRMLVDGARTRQALQGFVPRRCTTHAIFSLRDPIPLLTTAERTAAKLTKELQPIVTRLPPFKWSR